MNHQEKREAGSITVEASISLTFFTFAMICILFFINVGRAQLQIQVAANNAAREISQYMYLMKITGIYDMKNQIDAYGHKAAGAIGDTEKKLSNSLDGIKAIADKAGGTDFSDPGSIVQTIKDSSKDAQSIKENLGGLKNTFSDIANNPVGYLKSMAALVSTCALDKANNWLIGDVIGTALVKKNLGGSDADALLKSMNVDNGMDGLDLSHCVILQNGKSAHPTEDINIVVIYSVKVFPLLDVNFKVQYAVSASTRAWLGGDNLGIKKLVK